MPLTPFHFGPALLLEYLLRRRIDFGTFLLANVITDVRAMLVFFGVLPELLHGPFHQTYLGALPAASRKRTSRTESRIRTTSRAVC